MVNGDLTRYPEVGCPRGARTGEPSAKAGVRYCEPGWGPTVMGGTLRRSGPGGGPSHKTKHCTIPNLRKTEAKEF